ncbi:MAG: uroporphyrinogen-III synthase [Puniceicoccales bacterium]|jgi:uroporphyrinogen-III synthase|nr:uroporphyrinogen-III synthase [Puniceicoccales bacterium]
MKETAARPRPLAGKRIVVTRPEGTAAGVLRDALAAQGATVLDIPLIDIEYTADPAALEDVWSNMGQFDWLVFTSANGVRGFFERFFETFNDIRGIGPARIACVGDATTAAVRAHHLNVDFQPEKSTADDLARELADTEDLAHLRVLVVAGNKNSDSLAKTLETRGKAIAQTLIVYAAVENDIGQLDAAESFRRLGADAIVFASPSAADSFVAQAKLLAPVKTARHPVAVAIGPSTADALREHGIPVAAQAAEPTPAALAAAVAAALSPK